MVKVGDVKNRDPCRSRQLKLDEFKSAYTVIVVSFIEGHVKGFHGNAMIVTVNIERSTGDQASHDERERDILILVMALLRRKPEIVVLLGSGNELLLDGQTVGRMFKNVENVQATSQGCVTVEPLVMNGTQ